MTTYSGLITDETIDNAVSKQLLDKTNSERELRTPSGKLSASMLYMPLQWQILKTIGIDPKPFDLYTLRKFERGNHVEKWLIDLMPGVIDKQKFVTYMEAIGYIDAVVDTKDYQHNLGIVPHEIKSVSNAKFKRITTQGSPDMSHIFQACFYALATKSKHFAVDYVSTDDYRIESYIIPTTKYEKAVTEAIVDYKRAKEDWDTNGNVPIFKGNEKWMANIQYNNYPLFVELDQKECNELVQKMLKDKGGE